MADYVIKTTDGTLLPTKEAASQAAGLRDALDLGTLATQNGTFSGTSSGTNTGDQTITLTGDASGGGTGNINVEVKGVNGVVFDDLLSGILKIVEGQVSVAPAGDPYWPILNQNTTGTAANVPATGITGDTLPISISKSGLTTVGAITLGQWQSSTPVGIAYGGTGAQDKTAAFTALQPQNLFPDGSPSFAVLTANDTFNVGSSTVYASIDGTQGDISTKGSISADGAISTAASLITIANKSNPSNTTANGAGITVPSASGVKTLTWQDLNQAWTSNQNFNIADTKTYKINGIDVLSLSSLGSSVITSSLTSVGTIGSGYWNSNIGTLSNFVTADQVIAVVNAGGGGGIGTLDADLIQIAAIDDNSTGYLKKTAPNTWGIDSANLFVFQTDEKLTDARVPIIRDAELVSTTTNGWMPFGDKIKLDAYPAQPISFFNAALTGVPTAPTADSGTKTTQIATTYFVGEAIIDSEDTVFSKLFNNIINEGASAIAIIDDIYLNKYVRLTNTGSITITLFAILPDVLSTGITITFRRTTSAGAITLLPDVGVTINDVDTASVLAGDTFMIKYLGADTWDFI